MSYDTGRIEPQFVQPGDAAPLEFAFAHGDAAPPFRHDRTLAAKRAASARRSGRFHRLLPILFAVAATLVFATLTDGGSKARQTTPLASYLGGVLEKLGLGLTEVTVNGQSMTRDKEIYDQLRLSDVRSIWQLDTEAARMRVETLPWVSHASLKRVFPDRLVIEIQERTPHAIWSDGRHASLLDATGRILGPATKGRFEALPNIFGPGAAPHAADILAATNRMPALRGKVALYEWTAGRRWTLHLTSGRQVLLPAIGQSHALVQLVKGAPGSRLIDGNFKQLDLRLPGQIAVEFRE